MLVKTHPSFVIDFIIRTTSYCNQCLTFMRFSSAEIEYLVNGIGITYYSLLNGNEPAPSWNDSNASFHRISTGLGNQKYESI
jgi:hypothetical protein